jgi:hypothetical protein
MPIGTGGAQPRLRFEDAATGNLVKPSSFALLVQVPS